MSQTNCALPADQCSCSGSPALVPVMEAANLGNGNDRSDLRCLDCTWFRTVLLQRQMRPGPMIITAERLQMAVQTGLVEHNQVIKAFATYGANDPFGNGCTSTLPAGRSNSGVTEHCTSPTSGSALLLFHFGRCRCD